MGSRMGLDDQSKVSRLEYDKTRRVQWGRIPGAAAQHSDQRFYFPSQAFLLCAPSGRPATPCWEGIGYSHSSRSKGSA